MSRPQLQNNNNDSTTAPLCRPHDSSHNCSQKEYLCYVICSHDFRRTYAGMTNHLTRRLRQHDGRIKGGAKATRGFAPCKLLFVVRGVGGMCKRVAMRVEWRLKEHRNWRVPREDNALHKRQLLLVKMLVWTEAQLEQKIDVVFGLPQPGQIMP